MIFIPCQNHLGLLIAREIDQLSYVIMSVPNSVWNQLQVFAYLRVFMLIDFIGCFLLLRG